VHALNNHDSYVWCSSSKRDAAKPIAPLRIPDHDGARTPDSEQWHISCDISCQVILPGDDEANSPSLLTAKTYRIKGD
jgi:hypothetical protein